MSTAAAQSRAVISAADLVRRFGADENLRFHGMIHHRPRPVRGNRESGRLVTTDGSW